MAFASFPFGRSYPAEGDAVSSAVTGTLAVTLGPLTCRAAGVGHRIGGGALVTYEAWARYWKTREEGARRVAQRSSCRVQLTETTTLSSCPPVRVQTGVRLRLQATRTRSTCGMVEALTGDEVEWRETEELSELLDVL